MSLSFSLIIFNLFVQPVFAEPQNTLFSLNTNWESDVGTLVSLKDWKGHRLILTMIYTSCTKICPGISIKKLREIEEIFLTRSEKVEFILVTLDPTADDIASLQRFREKLDITKPNWHLLRASHKETDELAKMLGFSFWKNDEHYFHKFKIVSLGLNGEIEHVVDWDHRDVKKIF